MVVMMGIFIATGEQARKGYRAEKIVWEAIKQAFRDRESVSYLHYPIFGSRFGRKEPDILIFDRKFGVIIIEVKGIFIHQIKSIQGNQWNYQNYYTNQGNPYEQAESQMYALFDYIHQEVSLKNKISRRIFIALPFITREEWEEKGFSHLPSCPPIIFKNDLNERMLEKLESFSLYNSNYQVNDGEWQLLLRLVGYKEEEKQMNIVDEIPNYSLLYVASSNKELGRLKGELLTYLKKGIKVIILSNQTNPFDEESFKPFKKASLFQFICVEEPYQLEEPIIVVDGKGLSKVESLINNIPQFNKGQYVIEHSPVDSNLLVTAGAGTGKTYTMVQRIMFLLAMNPDLELKDIAMITFTREAAQEMRHRLKKQLITRYRATRNVTYLKHCEDLKDMPISTIHSFSKNLLSELGFVLGFGRNVAIKSFTQIRREILEQSIDEYLKGSTLSEKELTNFKPHELLSLLEMFWNEMEKKGLSEEQIKDLDWGSANESSKKLNELFQFIFPVAEAKLNEYKVNENAITIGDLVRKISQITSSQEEVLNEVPHRIKYLFVDEFQDSDDVQIQLVAKIHQLLKTKLFVVGDIKQSIYRFRGADYTAFDQLEQVSRSKFKKIPLKINYRTTASLLNDMGSFFEKWGREKKLVYREEEDGLISFQNIDLRNKKVELLRYKKDNLNSIIIRSIQSAIKDIKKQALTSGELENSRVALLVRTNKQASELYYLCKKHDIPAIIKTSGTFFNSQAIKDVLALVRALLYPSDPISLLNYSATPFCPDEVSTKLLIGARGNRVELLERLMRYDGLNKFRNDIVPLLRYRPVLSVIRKCIHHDVYTRLYDELVRVHGENEIQANILVSQYKKNIEYLFELIHQQFDSTNTSLYTLYKWLELSIKTNREVDEPEVDDSVKEDAVDIVTVHRSKGLEYHTVIIPRTTQKFTVERSVLLFDKDKQKAGWMIKQKDNSLKNELYSQMYHEEVSEVVKEETRLLYVAMTRSRERLMIATPYKSVPDSWSSLLKL